MTAPPCQPMYAITLHQPWASLIALGVKTRGNQIMAGAGATVGTDHRRPRR